MKKSTEELYKLIKEKRDVAEYLEENSSELLFSSVHELLEFHINSKGLNRSEVIDKANLAKSYGYQILQGKKNASRDKLLCLCFGMELNLSETNRVLKQAGLSALYPRVPKDAIIISCIEQKKTLMEANEKLDELGEKILE